MAQEGAGSGSVAPRRRTDLRLVLPAALIWAASVAGLWLPPPGLATLCGALAGAGGLILVRAAKVSKGLKVHAVVGRPAYPTHNARGRSAIAALGLSLMLAAAAAAHSATSATQRFDGLLADAVTAGKSAVAVVEVAGNPRAVAGPGGMDARWAVPVWTREVATGGVLVRTRARLVVMGGDAWGDVVPGQTLRATGKLRQAEPGEPEAGKLAASAAPGKATGGDLLEAGARELRGRFVSASAFLAPDARGLLPGMVTGDTSALDEGLGNAMKAVGMTHLTAVSGANCSLVLGALLVLCRRFRLPRVAAAACALTGLALFVVLVGPDASVLRAALMGAIGVASLAGGRSGRGLSFLCLAVIALLLTDPGLGSSYGFLLSVLATLGIILLGRRFVDWIPAPVPRWMAAAVTVPLSAQLLCGPVIILLQPQFATYSLLANVVASPLVAPVTLLGTVAVPLVVLLPWAAAALIAVAGLFSAGVAAIARFAAQLPGSALPWPEGVPGLVSMVLMSLVTVAAVWMATGPARLLHKVTEAHAATMTLIELVELRLQRLAGMHGLDGGRRRGRLGYSNKTSGRDRRWPLCKSEQPAPRHRMQHPGGTRPRPRLCWSAAPRSTWGSGPWTASGPGSGPPRRTSN
ncbi:ComEC/Rec2 family competence protein [Pseudarthrobacter sp. NPDC080039]|uniref:ComEC/Rec2 family competence protein n=1 Tax=unclassified Pseudarthrobacter TaxID=2647000 RepID=UPI003450ED96